jgi:hypothetical protein
MQEKCLCPVCGKMFEDDLPADSSSPMIDIGSMHRRIVPCPGKHSEREIWQAWRTYYQLDPSAS